MKAVFENSWKVPHSFDKEEWYGARNARDTCVRGGSSLVPVFFSFLALYYNCLSRGAVASGVYGSLRQSIRAVSKMGGGGVGAEPFISLSVDSLWLQLIFQRPS